MCVQSSLRAGSSAIDFQTESVLARNKKTERLLEFSVFYFVATLFRSESQLHMIQSFKVGTYLRKCKDTYSILQNKYYTQNSI